MTSELDKLSSLIMSGYFETRDLDSYLKKLITSYRSNTVFVKRKLNELFRHGEVCERLLYLAFNEPSELRAVLDKYIGYLNRVGSPLLKTYAISSLNMESPSLVRADLGSMIRSLVEAHPLVSLYNPLVIGFIAYLDNQLFHRSLVEPARHRAVLYEANPLTIKTILFRDMLLYTGLSMDKSIYSILYERYGLTDVNELFVKISSTMNESYASLYLNSYIRIVKGLLESIRAVVRGLESIDKALRRMRDVEIMRAYEKFIELYRGSIGKNREHLLRILNGLISVDRGDVREALLKTIDTLLDNRAVFEENIYDLLAFMLEATLFDEAMLKHSIPDMDRYVEVIDRYVETINGKLVKNKDIVEKTLNRDVEPHRTLSERIAERKRHRYLSWLER